jgi:signal transduction histidine kinase
LAQNSVYSVHRNHDGTVWAGTVSAGVSRLAAGKFTNFSEANGLPSNTIDSIVEGFDGTMWLATPFGLASFNNGKWTSRSARDGLPAPNVRTIFEDARHVLWIATSGGLASLSSGHINVPQKLPGSLREQIFGITEDGMGSLWFSTSDHVIQVNRERLLMGTLQGTDVQIYGMSDGLMGAEGVGRERTVISDAVGRIWVSLNRGLSVADPRVVITSSTPVAVRIESMSAGGDQVNLENQPRLRAGIESIVFDYASTNLAVPERIRFRYKLDGTDRGWSDIVASRQVTYTNLRPGSYVFRIVASNSEGLWNGPEATVPFVIEPAFWQSWWFRALCVAACLAIIMALYRLRMYQMTKRLNDRFQERLAERTRIAQELHDTLLQGVLSASLQLDVAEEQLPEDSPAKPLLRRVLQLMAKVTEEGRNALRGLRTTEADIRSLEMAFSRVRQEFTLNDKIGYRVITSNVARPVRPIIRDEVYRIGREALANAFLHAEANSIEIEVEYASRYLRVLVRDDGRGIDPQVLHSGREGHWGLSGMRERSEGIGASLKLRSRVGAGTEVELTVPSAIAFENDSRDPISQWLPWLSREKFENFATNKWKRAGK